MQIKNQLAAIGMVFVIGVSSLIPIHMKKPVTNEIFKASVSSEIVVPMQYKVDDTAEEDLYFDELIEDETIEIAEIEESVIEQTFVMSDDEIELLTLVTMAEAEGESEYGQRLVIDTILNRIDCERFDNSLSEVIYAPGQFSSVHNGRINRCYVKEDIYQLVIDELLNRTNDEVLYFTVGHYSEYGTPLFCEGNHYFSK